MKKNQKYQTKTFIKTANRLIKPGKIKVEQLQ